MKDMNDNTQEGNELIGLRRGRFEAFSEKMGEKYPNDFKRGAVAAELLADYGERSREELQNLDIDTAVTGRIMRMRGQFLVTKDGSGSIQLYMDNNSYISNTKGGAKIFFVKGQKASPDESQGVPLDLGDIIGAKGKLFKTRTGELTIRVESCRLLAKALRPLPDKHKGLQDIELRYRRRYLDLMVNEDSRKVFRLRSALLRELRAFFEAADYMEVETPMMQTLAGGALARPFVTHHNALDQNMYLRVAPELYLKRLIVGGFEKVFELNRSFRNEGLSPRHNPEFTMLEFYRAYATYKDMMDFTEELLRHLAQKTLGSTTLSYQGVQYDLSQSFTRMTLIEAVRRHCSLPKISLDDEDGIRAAAAANGIEADPAWPAGKLLLEIYERKVEPALVQPTFITEYPTAVSPLSRCNDANPKIVDRFELIIGGRELANGFSELNDPAEQARRFKEQAAQRQSGDDEAMPYDEDYITALEYGMPPTGGEGIGIDRLVMLFADAPSIKDVLLFPHNRPLQSPR